MGEKNTTSKIIPKTLSEKKMQELNKDEFVDDMNEALRKINEAAVNAKSYLTETTNPVHNAADKITNNKLVKDVSDLMNNQKSDTKSKERKDQTKHKNNLSEPKSNQPEKIVDKNSVNKVSD